jgi:HSP20 family protein
MFEYSKSGMFNLQYHFKDKYYRPPVDVIETDIYIIVRVEIAGMNEKEFDIKYNNNSLSIFGNRIDPIRNTTFHQMEINFGEFLIEIDLNKPIVADTISAEYRNGFLEVNLHKAEPLEIPIIDKDS